MLLVGHLDSHRARRKAACLSARESLPAGRHGRPLVFDAQYYVDVQEVSGFFKHHYNFFLPVDG